MFILIIAVLKHLVGSKRDYIEPRSVYGHMIMNNYVDLCRAELTARKKQTNERISRNMEEIINDVETESKTLARLSSGKEQLESQDTTLTHRTEADMCLRFVQEKMYAIKNLARRGMQPYEALEKFVHEALTQLPEAHGYNEIVVQIFTTLTDTLRKLHVPAATERRTDSQNSYLPGMTARVHTQANFLPPMSTDPVIAQPQDYYMLPGMPHGVGMSQYGMHPGVIQPQGYLVPPTPFGYPGNNPTSVRGTIQPQGYLAHSYVPGNIHQYY